MANRVNRTYLQERVQKESWQAIQRVKDEADAKVDKMKKDLLASVIVDEPSIKKLKRKIASLNKQLDFARSELKIISAEFQEEYPYLYLNPEEGRIEFRHFAYSDKQLPSPIDKDIEKVRAEALERRKDIESLCTAFLDKIMIGEATYEGFSELLAALKK
jgi:hypothetical protein